VKLVTTSLPDVWILEPAVHSDERGTFSTHFSTSWFREHGLQHEFVQSCIATNRRAGTLRGMHWQAEPHGEVKLVRCVRGGVYDVVLDLREDSASYGRWCAVELTAENNRVLYVPKGCAHGYQTLADDSWLSYEISAPYHAASARGVRWNDPSFGISWPDCSARTISVRDATYESHRP
jgi:dTDP-4-dehydrorhamnose 3,5-epimerase